MRQPQQRVSPEGSQDDPPNCPIEAIGSSLVPLDSHPLDGGSPPGDISLREAAAFSLGKFLNFDSHLPQEEER